jgi:TPR repeat protein
MDYNEEDEDYGEDDDKGEDNLTAGVTYKPYDYKTTGDYDSLLVKANQGDAEAQLLIGHAYEKGGFLFGRDIEQDYVLANKYYRMSAEQGNTEAMFQLGATYTGCYDEEGEEIIANDNNEVVKWITLAAKNGHINAQNYLGTMYRSGSYIEENPDEAIKWFKLAANQGHVYSQTYLGYMYNIGEGVDQDYSESMKWTQLAAAQGNNDAQFNIGWMYYHGHGVPVNKKVAKKWYRIACNNGHEIAGEHLWEFKNTTDEDQ